MQIIVIGLLIAIIAFDFYKSTQKSKRRILTDIRNSWGNSSGNEAKESDFESFTQLFGLHDKAESKRVIDDITWNDLEMDRLFNKINRTHTSMGDNVLYKILRNPLFDREKYAERIETINYWADNQQEREQTQIQLSRAGKFKPNRMGSIIDGFECMELNNKWLHKLLTFLLLASFPVIFIKLELGLLMAIVFAGINVLYHEYAVKKIHIALESISQVTSIVFLAGRLIKKRPEGLDARYSRLNSMFEELKPLLDKGALKNIYIQFTGDMSTDMTSITKMIFLLDLWFFQSFIDFIKKHTNCLSSLIEEIGEIDATVSIASYRQSLEEWCEPEILWDGGNNDFHIKAEVVCHPLINECTPNSICSLRPTLITGSNASGKSTFLKALAINTLLAHTIGICHASRWMSVPMFPITSMALKDSVLNGESYFVAEIKSMKRIFEAVDDKVKCLCVIDEILRGTNTIERIASASRILAALTKLNICIFAATHDIEITSILNSKYENMHFEESVNDNEICFDYKLKTGKATTRNAIKLLKLMKFDADIIDGAIDAVNSFEKNKSWSEII